MKLVRAISPRHQLIRPQAFDGLEEDAGLPVYEAAPVPQGYHVGYPVFGVLENDGFIDTYAQITNDLLNLADDPNCEDICLIFDSPGGSALGCFEAAEIIGAVAKEKPVYGLVYGECCSAAYALASQCTRLYTSPSAYIGSIGVITDHVDISEANAKQGKKVTHISTVPGKTDWSPDHPLSPEARAREEQRLGDLEALFHSTVAAGRAGLTAPFLKGLQGDVFVGARAVSLNLADGVVNPHVFAEAFASGTLTPEEKGH